MCPSKFEELYRRHRAGSLPVGDFWKLAKDVELHAETIDRLLRQEWEAQNWGMVQSLVVIAMLRPSGRYVDLLCRMLDELHPEVLHEDVAELLFDIGDERSVPSLVRALQAELPGDHFHGLNKKCIWALGKIGTNDAIRAIEACLCSEHEEIREAAKRELDIRR